MSSSHSVGRAALCVALVFAAGCFVPGGEADCLRDGTCECKQKRDCDAGLDCVDGKCLTIVFDAGTGELGDPCLENGECQSGLCLPKGPGNGFVCTIACDGGSSCSQAGTQGWQCKPTGAGANVCVPPFKSLCQPCGSAADCNIHGDECVSVGGQSFCGLECSFASCPAGYSCSSVARSDGGVVRQCLPAQNSCECSPATVGLTRSCNNDGGIALCFGVETCLGDGTWSTCDAKQASKEVCDGEDNDCDGLTDQFDPSLDVSALPGYPTCRNGDGGTCVGVFTCGALDSGFGFFCSGKRIEPEACNARDDDCNGRADETFLDPIGRYADVHHCNACGFDCETRIGNLADAGVDGGQVACEVRAGTLSCVPKKCEPGYYPWPPAAPQICQKAATTQCRPCGADSDCQTPSDRCVGVGADQGTFCAQSCDLSAPYAGCTGIVGQQGCCPTDSSCAQVGSQKLCLPNGNSCLCSPSRAGFRRSCLRDAGTAVCVGTETCMANGAFAGCDTAQTALELCDGQDNDCNGAADEPFINTRNTATYDTDEHCGSCSQNCLAQWSPTIQHAVGGCVVDAGVSCQIVRCTQESIPGGGACRLDSECGAGRSCHPLYRQCVQSCSSAATCGANGACVKGFCTKSCASDSDCVTAFGAPSSCLNNVCEAPYQFTNPDKDSTNGCECPAATSVTDQPDVYASYPTAGLPYVDRDCDGIDGQLASSLFVWSQSGQSLGTRASPFRTISEAIAVFDPSRHSAILVAAGIYAERVVLKNGIKLYGGYSSNFSRRDVVTLPTLVEASEPDLAVGQRRGTVNAEGINASTVIAGFTVRGYDVTFRPGLGGTARNSYAFYVKDSGPELVIQNNHIIGGRGGDGAAGLPGTAGANGGIGANGLPARECASASCANEAQPGGGPGANSSCFASNGQPGAQSSGNTDPQGYTSSANGNGIGGGNATYRFNEASLSHLCKYDCSFGGGNVNGGAAQNGGDGAAPSGGSGCNNPSGGLSGDDWVAGAGAAGSPGTAGRGGGGGGAGGIVRNQNPPSCNVGNRLGDLGGTGGGGGAGGCAGTGGGAARGGGGSFALFILYTTALTPSAPTVEGNLVEVGAGGQGGSGGSGGYGGLGGQGGEGGPQTSVAWCAGQGGHGGRGGNGGAGSGGGGGCGGSAFGIAGNFAASTNFNAKNSLTAPSSSAAGSAGGGGSSPRGGVSNGQSGASGIAQTVRTF